jgi:anti-anti-sigma factor
VRSLQWIERLELMISKGQISVVENDSVVTVIGGGSLDITNCREFTDGLKHVSRTAESVVVDLRQADFIDTQIVQDLAKAAVTLMDRGKRLKVLASQEKYPLRVIHISGFDSIMDVVVE